MACLAFQLKSDLFLIAQCVGLLDFILESVFVALSSRSLRIVFCLALCFALVVSFSPFFDRNLFLGVWLGSAKLGQHKCRYRPSRASTIPWHGMACYGMARHSMSWYCMAWYGMVWHGIA